MCEGEREREDEGGKKAWKRVLRRRKRGTGECVKEAPARKKRRCRTVRTERREDWGRRRQQGGGCGEAVDDRAGGLGGWVQLSRVDMNCVWMSWFGEEGVVGDECDKDNSSCSSDGN